MTKTQLFNKGKTKSTVLSLQHIDNDVFCGHISTHHITELNGETVNKYNVVVNVCNMLYDDFSDDCDFDLVFINDDYLDNQELYHSFVEYFSMK